MTRIRKANCSIKDDAETSMKEWENEIMQKESKKANLEEKKMSDEDFSRLENTQRYKPAAFRAPRIIGKLPN
ncbi:MAG: hypothetical protein OXE99_04810 [Cellvibrionales bacterium]|nr:hypothetical protein [Cellvibrionales bacterium]